jgi:hypothetical protein
MNQGLRMLVAFNSIVVFLLSLNANAQSSLTVYLYEQNTQNPIPAHSVVLEHAPTGLQLIGLTDDKGTYTFKNLNARTHYSVIALESPAYKADSVTHLNLRSNEGKYLDFGIRRRQSVDLDEIVVKSKPSQRINRTNAEVAFELDEQNIQAIPVEGRDITRVLFRMPNVSQATGFYPEAPNVSINGANPLYSSYLIDGMDNNERFLGGQKFPIPTGFTQNITLLTNNYSAEYGLAGNGVLDITTKSGTNEFSGEVFTITRPGAVLDGNTRFPQRDLSGNLVKEGFQRYQAGVGFGGALVKDKTFYYINVEHTTDLKQNILNSPALGVSENVNGQNQFTYLSGKIDQVWNKKFRSSLRFNEGIVRIENPGGGLSGGITFPSAGLVQDRLSRHLALKNTYHTQRVSVQTNLQYSRFRWNYGRPIQGGNSPQVTVLDPMEIPAAVLGHPGFVFDQTEHTFQWQQKLTLYLGNHILKAGGGIVHGRHSLFGGGNPRGSYRVKLSESQQQNLDLTLGSNLSIRDLPVDIEVLNYNVELRPNSFGRNQTVYSFFIEDQFRLNHRLNITAGLRYDYDNLTADPNGQGDQNNIAPRLNLNYKLTENAVLRGGYGIFYDKIIYAVISDALQQNTVSPDYAKQVGYLLDQNNLQGDYDVNELLFNGNLQGSLDEVDYLEGPVASEIDGPRESIFSNERRILPPNGLDNPLTHQFSLGYQNQLNENTLFFVDLMHNRSYNLFRLRNLNRAAPYPIDPQDVDIRTMAEADAERLAPVFFDDESGQNFVRIGGERLYGGARNVMLTETAGKSRYYAASFNLQKERGGEDYSFLLNYTLSRLRNNTEDINFRAMDANDFEAEWGPSINDRTHILNGIFTYYLKRKWQITAAVLLQSGQPINRIPDASEFGTADLNGDGASFGDAYVGNSDRHPGASRNSDRLPWANTFDVSISYDWSIASHIIEFRADIFNIFNAQNLSGYSNNATQSNQIQPGSIESGVLIRRNASPPRQFQFSLRYLW